MPQAEAPGQDDTVQPGVEDNEAIEAEEPEQVPDNQDDHLTDQNDQSNAATTATVAQPIPAPTQPQRTPPIQQPLPTLPLQPVPPPAINTNSPLQIHLRIPSAFTDPSDSEYDVAVKSLRDARRKSYYRLKPSHYSQRDPKKLRLKIRRKADQPKSASTFDYAKNQKRLQRAKDVAQRPVNPPRTPAEELQTLRNEVARLGLPDLPPDVDVDDGSFRWFMGHYLRRRADGGLEWWDHEAVVPQWREQEVWPDTEQNRLLGRVGKPRLRGG